MSTVHTHHSNSTASQGQIGGEDAVELYDEDSDDLALEALLALRGDRSQDEFVEAWPGPAAELARLQLKLAHPTDR